MTHRPALGGWRHTWSRAKLPQPTANQPSTPKGAHLSPEAPPRSNLSLTDSPCATVFGTIHRSFLVATTFREDPAKPRPALQQLPHPPLCTPLAAPGSVHSSALCPFDFPWQLLKDDPHPHLFLGCGSEENRPVLPVGRGPRLPPLLVGVDFLQFPKKTHFLRFIWENQWLLFARN